MHGPQSQPGPRRLSEAKSGLLLTCLPPCSCRPALGTKALTQSGWVMVNGGGEVSRAGGPGACPPSVARPGLPGPAGRRAGSVGTGCSLVAPTKRRAHALNGRPVAILRAGLVVPPGLPQWLPRPGVPLPASGASGLGDQPRPAGGRQRQPPLCPDCPAGEACPRGWGAHRARVLAPTTSVPRCPSRWTGYPWQPAPSSLTVPAAFRPGTHCVAGASSRAGEHRACAQTWANRWRVQGGRPWKQP